MKRGQKLIAVGYKVSKLEDKKPKWPPFLEKGVHRISIIKKVTFGILIKTDRHPEWINTKWFLPV